MGAVGAVAAAAAAYLGGGTAQELEGHALSLLGCRSVN